MKIKELKLRVFNLLFLLNWVSLNSQIISYWDSEENLVSSTTKTFFNGRLENINIPNISNNSCKIRLKAVLYCDSSSFKKLNNHFKYKSIINQLTNYEINTKGLNFIKNGFVYVYDANDRLKYEILYEKGEIHYFIEYTESLEVLQYLEFSNNKLHGVVIINNEEFSSISSYENGSLISNINLTKNKMFSKMSNSKYISWVYDNLKKSINTIIELNKNGDKNGEKIRYYQNGNVELIGNYQNNKMQGKWMYYNPDGSLLLIEKWIDDKLIESICPDGTSPCNILH